MKVTPNACSPLLTKKKFSDSSQTACRTDGGVRQMGSPGREVEKKMEAK